MDAHSLLDVYRCWESGIGDHVIRNICCCGASSCLCTPRHSQPIQAQQHVLGEDIMAQQGNKVPGNNDAVYAVVPEEDQLFKVEFLEVALTPIPT